MRRDPKNEKMGRIVFTASNFNDWQLHTLMLCAEVIADDYDAGMTLSDMAHAMRQGLKQGDKNDS